MSSIVSIVCADRRMLSVSTMRTKIHAAKLAIVIHHEQCLWIKHAPVSITPLPIVHPCTCTYPFAAGSFSVWRVGDTAAWGFLSDRAAHAVWSAIGMILSSICLPVRLSVCGAVHCGEANSNNNSGSCSKSVSINKYEVPLEHDITTSAHTLILCHQTPHLLHRVECRRCYHPAYELKHTYG